MKLDYLIKFYFCLLIILSINISNAGTQGDVWSSAITKWDGNCSGSTRHWWDDMCMAWRKKMGSKGWNQHWRNFHLVTADRYVDSKYAAWGDDHLNIDATDAGLICTHGGHGSNGWYGVMHTKSNGHCNLDTNEMRLGPKNGDGALRFFHMSSCNSVRWDKRTKWFLPASDKVHVITGFHGYMYIGSKYVKEYRKLASKAQTSRGVGKTWVDQMHHVDHWYNSWATVCPISLGFGATEAQAVNAQNERYRSKWSHKNPNWMSARYKAGCNPDDGNKLPK